MNPQDELIKIIAEVTLVPADAITESDQRDEYVYARHLLFYCLNTQLKQSKATIGRRFKRDRTTVTHAISKIAQQAHATTKDGRALYPALRADLSRIIQKIESLIPQSTLL